MQDTLLLGNGDECLHALDAIDRDFGLSLWSIEQRIAVLSLHQGLEAQKAYVQKVRSESISSTVRFFAAMWSVRNEMATHFETFKRELVSKMPQWTESKAFASYALFRCVDHWQPTQYVIANALRWEYNNSTIDLYETFVRIAQRVISLDALAITSISDAVARLMTLVKDERLNLLKFVATGSTEGLDAMTIAVSPLSDKWYQVSDPCVVANLETSTEIEDMVAKGLARADCGIDVEPKSDTLRERIIYLITGAAQKASRLEESRASLLHLYTNLTALDSSSFLQIATLDLISSDPVQPRWRGIEAFSRSTRLHPSLIQFLPIERQSQVLRHLGPLGASSASISIALMRVGRSHDQDTQTLDPKHRRSADDETSERTVVDDWSETS